MKQFRTMAIVLALLVTAAGGLFVHAAQAQEDGTPAAEATPLAEGTPAAQPILVITLVAWYETDPSGDFIQVGPMASNDQLIAGPGDSTDALTGRADFDGS